MTELRVVDLGSQARAVANHIKGWGTSDVLAWLGQYGDIRSAHPDNPNAYIFHSHAGVTTGFMFEEGGILTIIGDHTTIEIPGTHG
jgi:hypothetical protein